jgi:hypothetical protein
VFWQNRSFYIGVGALGTGTQNQQNVVTLYDAFTTTVAPSQTATGQCPAPVSYWDIGVRGDTGPGNHASTVTLRPQSSILTNASENAGVHNLIANPNVVSQYCNGSRVPPELGASGWQVPPGISDATVPNPIFDLTPAATVDEGNNWVNIAWGPLAETNPAGTVVLGNYAPAAATSPVVNYITNANSATTYAAAPSSDFFGVVNRKANNAVDIGAVEFTATGGGGAAATLTPASNAFGNATRGCTLAGPGACPAQLFTLTNTGNANLTGITVGTVGGTNASDFPINSLVSTCGPAVLPGKPVGLTTLAPGQVCTITVRFAPTTAAGDPAGAKSATLSVTDSAGTQTSTPLSGVAQ